MKQILETVYLAFHNTLYGSAYALGNALGANQSTISVLCYHGISNQINPYSTTPLTFERQIKNLVRHMNVISLKEAMSVFEGKSIRRPAVALTFDDGYADVLENALLITERYNIKSTVFVLSDPEHADRKQLGSNRRLLSWGDIRLLHTKGWTIGCHSAKHPDFGRLSPTQMEEEVVNAKKTLEGKLGYEIEYFAYPNGIATPQIIAAVQRAGYKAAFAVRPGSITNTSNRWVLPRTMVDNSVDVPELPILISNSSFAIRRFTERLDLRKRLVSI